MMKNKKIGDIIWFIYLLIMFNFYNITIIQLLGQILVILYTVIDILSNKIITKDMLKVFRGIFCWMGLFTIWVWLSQKWAVYPVSAESNTVLAVFRITAMSFCLSYYVLKQNDYKNLLSMFVENVVIFGILALFSNKISVWGTTNFTSFNNGYHRNGVAYYALIANCFNDFLKNKTNKNKRKFITYFLWFIIFICGSRGSLILLILYELFKILSAGNLKVKFKRIIILFICALIVFFSTYNIKYFRETYYDRMYQVFLGKNSNDDSVIGRSKYVEIGYNMFLKRPILGWGVDGFYNYLGNNIIKVSNSRLMPVYSHNNYIEILSCYGIVGFIIFYIMYLKLLKINFKYRKEDNIHLLILIVMLLSLVNDLKSIVFSLHIPIYVFTIFYSMSIKNSNKYACRLK